MKPDDYYATATGIQEQVLNQQDLPFLRGIVHEEVDKISTILAAEEKHMKIPCKLKYPPLNLMPVELLERWIQKSHK